MSKQLNSNICDKCSSVNLRYTKLLGIGYVAYKAECLDCGRRRHVHRTKQIFDIVKDQVWLKSKKLKEFEKLSLL